MPVALVWVGFVAWIIGSYFWDAGSEERDRKARENPAPGQTTNVNDAPISGT